LKIQFHTVVQAATDKSLAQMNQGPKLSGSELRFTVMHHKHAVCKELYFH